VHDLRGYTIPAKLTAEPRFKDAKEVFMQFGRIRRGGIGVESTYDMLKDKLSTISRRNADTVAAKLNLTWDTMIVYQLEHYGEITTLFAIHGTDNNGKEYMYDRAGVGAGGYSKIYSLGGTKENVSNIVSGNKTAADFK
jgi:hypothetical protein